MSYTKTSSWGTLRLCLGLPEHLYLKKLKCKKVWNVDFEDVILLYNFTGQQYEANVSLNFYVYYITKSKSNVNSHFLKRCLSLGYLVYPFTNIFHRWGFPTLMVTTLSICVSMDWQCSIFSGPMDARRTQRFNLKAGLFHAHECFSVGVSQLVHSW